MGKGKGIVDVMKTVILEPTNEELAECLLGRISTLKKSIATKDSKEDEKSLIEGIEDLSIQLVDKLLPKNEA